MTLKELKKSRIFDIKHRILNLMYENFYGGDTIIVGNNKDVGMGMYGVPQYEPYFSVQELEFINNENILDEIKKEGWEITITPKLPAPQLSQGLDIIFTFKAVKETE